MIWSCTHRYEDAIDYYRKAIEGDPKLWSARSQLGINLMRMGKEDEPMQQLQMCYDNGYRDKATVNSLRLLDSYKNFVTFKDDTTILASTKRRRSCYIRTTARRSKIPRHMTRSTR